MTVQVNRSRSAAPETPATWQHVNIVEEFEGYRLTTGTFDSFIGYQTCAAAKIPRADKLTIQEAMQFGEALEKWLRQQVVKK